MACASTPPKPKTQNFDQFLQGFIQKYNIPGASLAVAKNGQIIHTSVAGYADVENKVAPTPETPFRIASSSKPITGIAVMMLLENSGTDLQTALNRPVFGPKGYLPEYKKIKDKRALKVTLRDLLQHTGGWDSANEKQYDPQYDLYNIAKKMKVKAPADAKSVIRYMLQYNSLDVAPGKEYHYSNFGFNILGRVIEKLSGETYEQYVQNHIFKPLGITDMKIAGSRLQDLLPNESRYYDDPRAPMAVSQFDGKTKGPEAYNEFYFPTMDAHGGFLGTPSSMVKILHAVTPELGGVQLLKPETIAVMTAPVMTIGNPTASLSWVVREGGKEISHAGALEHGTLAYFVRRPDNVTWAVLFNRLPIEKIEQLGPIAQDMIEQMNKAIAGDTADKG
jgi:CubicO group peptidase (beta-lactamase class C family)